MTNKNMEIKRTKTYITNGKTIAKKLGIKEEITHIFFRHNGVVEIDVKE
jgi:hypothetical protein